jgi:hypothetical protein
MTNFRAIDLFSLGKGDNTVLFYFKLHFTSGEKLGDWQGSEKGQTERLNPEGRVSCKNYTCVGSGPEVLTGCAIKRRWQLDQGTISQ